MTDRRLDEGGANRGRSDEDGIRFLVPGGADVGGVRRAMAEKMAEIRGEGGEVLNPPFEIERGKDVPNAQARFDFRLTPACLTPARRRDRA